MTNFRGLVMNAASRQVDAGWAFMKHTLTNCSNGPPADAPGGGPRLSA